MAWHYAFSLLLIVPAVTQVVAEKHCNTDAVDSEGDCLSEPRGHALLQQRFETKEGSMQPASCSGTWTNDRCWYLGGEGDSCDKTCTSHGAGCSFMFGAPPGTDMAPVLVGHVPHGRMDPWLFAECYVAKEDRYHPYNPNAWGNPDKTPAADVVNVGQYSYPTCMLSCPCQGTCSGAPPPFPTAFPGQVPSLPGQLSSTTPLFSTSQPPLPQQHEISRCSDGVGISEHGHCWYQSQTGGNCDDTCAARGMKYTFAAPASDITPRLVNHIPAGKQEPWAHQECYVASEDRYHPFNPEAWGVPANTPVADLDKTGQFSHENCQLACSCAGQPGPAVAVTTTVAGAPLPPRPTDPTSPPMPTNLPQGNCGLNNGGVAAGSGADSRCWYQSAKGQSCDSTCAAQGCTYQFAAPPEGDMVPLLVGHIPHTKQEPWLFVECYAHKEDRYHPYSPNAAKSAIGEPAGAGKYSNEECMLSCPCVCGGGIVPAPTPTPQFPVPTPWPVPAPVPPAPTPWGVQASCSGIAANQRCWYLSNIGDSCDTTCASHGAGCLFMFAAPPDTDMVPQLVGHQPHGKMDPWLFAECYVAMEDKYHPYSPNAWGTPDKTTPAEVPQVGQYSHPNCMLSCPCTGACTGAPPPVPTWAPEVPTLPPSGPASPVLPRPVAPAFPSSAPQAGALRCDDGEGVSALSRCWYLSKVGDTCDATCGARGLKYLFAAPVPDDMTPKLVGHVPKLRQSPWLFAECYVPGEDRYHPYNPNAWGVPEKTPAAEMPDAGQYKYDTCQLACPCAGRDIS